MGKRFLSEKYKNLSASMDAKSKNLSGKKLINLGIGDLDIHTDETIINEAFQDVLKGHTHYTDPRGYEELRNAIIEYHKTEFENYEFNKEQVIVLSGACHGMYLALQAITNPEDEIVIFSPFFPVYVDQIKIAGGIPVIVETKIENGYQIEQENLERAITPKTKAIILNTPSNPTGVCYNQESLNIVSEISKKYDLLVLADDIYDFYSYEQKFIPIYTLDGMEERTISICSFSKNYAMTGWRVGYNVGPIEIIECIKNINEGIVYSTSAPAQRAALSALKNRDKIREKLVPIYEERMKYVSERIKKMDKLKFFNPQGGIYVFVNIEKTGYSSEDFSKKLLEEQGVVVIEGTPFGDKNSIRIACTVPIKELEEAFDRIEEFMLTL
jgi:aspartate/methionine/tyrosine aminotransferase